MQKTAHERRCPAVETSTHDVEAREMSENVVSVREEKMVLCTCNHGSSYVELEWLELATDGATARTACGSAP